MYDICEKHLEKKYHINEKMLWLTLTYVWGTNNTLTAFTLYNISNYDITNGKLLYKSSKVMGSI